MKRLMTVLTVLFVFGTSAFAQMSTGQGGGMMGSGWGWGMGYGWGFGIIIVILVVVVVVFMMKRKQGKGTVQTATYGFAQKDSGMKNEQGK